jgi:hypothetical protein
MSLRALKGRGNLSRLDRLVRKCESLLRPRRGLAMTFGIRLLCHLFLAKKIGLYR